MPTIQNTKTSIFTTERFPSQKYALCSVPVHNNLFPFSLLFSLHEISGYLETYFLHNPNSIEQYLSAM
jgi:hypothetical protein